MMRTIQLKEQGILLELGHLNPMLADQNSPTREYSPTPAAVVRLVEEFSKIFAAPSGLPPVRERDHAIILKEGNPLVSVRSYHYPQIVKDEIERLVAEMLVASIIQLSTSPFSSLSLLVKKKKDGSWRFCVDYRALN